MSTLTVISDSPAQTCELASRLARLLRAGDCVALHGELGSGKTHFVKGLAAGLGADSSEPVASPTFVLLREYRGRAPLLHSDVYRLPSSAAAVEAGLREVLEDERAIVVVEWAERVADLLPPAACHVLLRHEGSERRRIEITWPDPRAAELAAARGGAAARD